MSSIPVSMINEVINCKRSCNEDLYVGLCGTKFVGSDCYPVVITEIISPKAVRVANMSDNDYNSNRYHESNGNESIFNMSDYICINKERTKIVAKGDIYKLRKNNRWIEEGHGLWETGGVHFGKAELYLDPSF